MTYRDAEEVMAELEKYNSEKRQLEAELQELEEPAKQLQN